MSIRIIHPIVAVLLLGLFIGACSKPNPEEQYTYKVREASANTPVAAATVDLYKCVSKDWLGNCNSIGSFITSTTSDNEGNVSFSKSLDAGTLKIRKDKYWDHEVSNLSFNPEFYLTPVATLKVHVIKVNSYPANYVLNLVSQPQGCNDCVWETKQVGQPVDTYVYLKAGGYYNNSVGWYMNPGGPATGTSTPPIMINRFDTAQVEIRY